MFPRYFNKKKGMSNKIHNIEHIFFDLKILSIHFTYTLNFHKQKARKPFKKDVG
jgi:hypothetical protein